MSRPPLHEQPVGERGLCAVCGRPAASCDGRTCGPLPTVWEIRARLARDPHSYADGPEIRALLLYVDELERRVRRR
jgi:hypothetical protein